MTVNCITTDMNCKETMHQITIYFNCGKEKFCILLKIIVHVTEMIWTQNLMTLFDWFFTSPKFNFISFVVTVCFRSRHSPSVTVFDTVWVSRATGGGVPGNQRFLIYSDIKLHGKSFIDVIKNPLNAKKNFNNWQLCIII